MERVCGSRAFRTGFLPVYCTVIRWHYHYLASRLISATREMIKTGVGYPAEPLKRFWATTDERGLIYRLIDENGYTYWQARWDASGCAWSEVYREPNGGNSKPHSTIRDLADTADTCLDSSCDK